MKIISLLVGLIRSNSPERAHPRTALTAMRLGRGVYAACALGSKRVQKGESPFPVELNAGN